MGSEPHDLAVSKLVAAREKDLEFCEAATKAGLVDLTVLTDRLDGTERPAGAGTMVDREMQLDMPHHVRSRAGRVKTASAMLVQPDEGSAMTATKLDGPIPGRPWSAPIADLTARGYVMEEFLVEGTATCYEPVGELEAGGRWTVKPGDAADYRSRILVVRPADAGRFNGTVLVHWLNVTAGYELGTADNDEILSGYAWVGVSAQKVGIHGRPPGAPAYSGRQLPGKPLREWNPERYGSLEHPGDRFSFDIFTQAARAPSVRTGPRRPTRWADCPFNVSWRWARPSRALG